MSYKHKIEKAPTKQGLMPKEKLLSLCKPIIRPNSCKLQDIDKPFLCNMCNYFLVSNKGRFTKVYCHFDGERLAAFSSKFNTEVAI